MGHLDKEIKMPVPKNKQDLYGKVIGGCLNKGGSKAKCKARAEKAVVSKKKTKKKKRK